jgi:SET domain-containing protein
MLDLYPVFCNEHGPIAYNMEVKASTIPGAGLGLFTLTDLQAGDFVALYHSDVRLVQGEEKNNDYCLEIPPDLHAGVMFMIDASDVGSTLGRYANDSRCSLPNGSYAFQPTPEGYMIPFIKASRAIRAGEEIFVAYGQSYWDAHDRRARTNNTASVL